MSKTVVIGIDPGSVVTGYGLLTRDLQPLDYGCVRPPKSAKPSERRLVIFDAISHLLEQHKPTALAIETQFTHPKNPMSGIIIGMVRGVIILAASRAQIPVFEYTPSETKRAATGNGQARKGQVQGMIASLLRLQEPPPEDAADALAIALCHINRSAKCTPI
jgi:crossover junction endodeoxyribonuclease RuvC